MIDDLDFESIEPQEGPQTFLLQTDAQDILYGGARGRQNIWDDS